MFVEPSTVNLSIGKIQMALANDIISKDKDRYSIANAEQSLLQGDPALKLVTVNKPDYSIDPDEGITLYSQSADKTIEVSDSLHIVVSLSNQGRFIKSQIVPLSVTYFGKKGNIIKTESMMSFPYQDTIKVTFANSKDIERVQVHIDPKHSISELNNNNNLAELEMEWDEIKNKSSFASSNVKDLIAPVLIVKFNGNILKQDEVINVNPIITFNLQDDRQIFSDTSLVDIFVKRCGDDKCDFEKVIYKSSGIELDSIDSHSFTVKYSTEDFNTGIYELLVTVRDRAGNSTVQPYRIRFQIRDDSTEVTSLIVSPNPAYSYLKFEIKTSKQDLKSARYVMFSQSGKVVEDKEVQMPVVSRSNEWYWIPTSLPSGLYAYKVILKGSDGHVFDTISGKVVLVK
jgi:hypothetical protein